MTDEAALDVAVAAWIEKRGERQKAGAAVADTLEG
jgi:hypothetical protein